MATDRSNPADKGDSSSSKKPGDASNSMKERLLAQRRAEAEGAPGSASAVPPVPAARPAASSPTARAQAAAAAARAAPAPAPPPRAAPQPAPQPASEARGSATSRRSVPLSGAREEERAARREKKGASSEVMREVELLRKQQDKWIMYGWIVAGGMLLIAGIVYFVVHGKKVAADEALAADFAMVKNFIDDLQKLDAHKSTDIEKGLALLEDSANDNKWKVQTYSAYDKATQWRGTAQREREHQKQIKELQDGMADLEAICGNAGSRTSEDLAKARRRINEYTVQGADLDEAFKLRVARASMCIDKAYVTKLRDDAKAMAAKGPAEGKNALTAFGKAEDEVTRMLDDAIKGHKPQEVVDFYMGELKAIIPESDAVVAQVFTPEVIEKTPWTDLLAESQKANWQNDAFKGWQIKDGVLQGVGPDLDSKKIAIMSVNDNLPMRDFVMECEFTLVKGEATFYFRLGGSVNNAMNMNVSTTGGTPFKAGQPNTTTVEMIGSKFKMTFGDGEHNAFEDEMRMSVRRKGSIGIAVPPGSEIRVTKLRVKILR
jgi:hypothetical protein